MRSRSPIGRKYDAPVNRESAYEILGQRTAPGDAPSPAPRAERGRTARPASGRPAADAPAAEPAGSGGGLSDLLWGTGRRQGMVETLAKQTARTVGSQLGRQILRGVLGGILGGRSRSR